MNHEVELHQRVREKQQGKARTSADVALYTTDNRITMNVTQIKSHNVQSKNLRCGKDITPALPTRPLPKLSVLHTTTISRCLGAWIACHAKQRRQWHHMPARPLISQYLTSQNQQRNRTQVAFVWSDPAALNLDRTCQAARVVSSVTNQPISRSHVASRRALHCLWLTCVGVFLSGTFEAYCFIINTRT